MNEVSKLRSLLEPKEIQVLDLKYQIQAQELLLTQIKDKRKNNYFIRKLKKDISEQITITGKKLGELDLKVLEFEEKMNFRTAQAEIVLKDFREQLRIELLTIKHIKKQITKAMRNHKVGGKK